MAWVRAAGVVAIAIGVALLAVSGGTTADPRTPPGLRGMPAPFLGVAVLGDGRLTAAVDAYGDIVDLRPGPASEGLIDNPSARQLAGTVPAGTGIVPRIAIAPSRAMPLWRASRIRQSYVPGTNVLRTAVRVRGGDQLLITDAARGETLARIISVRPRRQRAATVVESLNVAKGGSVRCRQRHRPFTLLLLCSPTGKPAADAPGVVRAAIRSSRAWIAKARPLSGKAPPWARHLYQRSLLVLRTFADSRSGAVAAGARDSWAYVWPRDAAAVAMALHSAGYRHEAAQVVRFLHRLDLRSAARFRGDGSPVGGRSAEGDARGWVLAAQRAVGGNGASGLSLSASWRRRDDYREDGSGDYLGNAVASPAARTSARSIEALFGTPGGLIRRAGDPASGLDAAAAWAVRPFADPALFPVARRTLLHLSSHAGPFGITPGTAWPGRDPWTAPTAWTAWGLAALGDRRAAIRLLRALRRAATPAGLLPERLDARTGVPRSTTPLAWSHAFAVLALQELWPGPRREQHREARPQ